MTEKKLSILDKYLPVWIGLTMAFGVLLGKFAPKTAEVIDSIKFGTVSVPIAIGLLWMMYPVLAKVDYAKIPDVTRDWKVFAYSIFLNWAVGPFLMYGLAKLFLANYPEYQMGLILVGIARCIAMVLIWNLLAGGNNEKAAILVAVNSVMQIFLYSVYAYFLIGTEVNITMWSIAKNVLIYLGIPLAAGYLTRFTLIRIKNREWYETKFMPKLSPTAMIGLLFTIVVMFAMQGETIINNPLDILIIAVPLTLYFVIMFLASLFSSWLFKFNYESSVTISFTAASNNFELAIAVAVGLFTIASKQALATTVGPLIEVPVLLALVYFAKWSKKWLFKEEISIPEREAVQSGVPSLEAEEN